MGIFVRCLFKKHYLLPKKHNCHDTCVKERLDFRCTSSNLFTYIGNIVSHFKYWVIKLPLFILLVLLIYFIRKLFAVTL